MNRGHGAAARSLAIALALSASIAGLLLYVRGRPGNPPMRLLSSQARAGGPAPLLELPVPLPLQKGGEWITPAAALTAVPKALTPRQFVDQLEATIPSLPGFARDRRPIPIWTVEGSESGPLRVTPASYVLCGFLETDGVVPFV